MYNAFDKEESMEHYTCQECGVELPTGWRGRNCCPSCAGRRGWTTRKAKTWPNKITPKEAKIHPSGYFYYTRSMCTPDEIAMLPGSNRCILVHRLIMAKHIGRPITKNEVIMHIDGNKQNNDISNLQLGDALTNSRQHWAAEQSAAFWRNAAVVTFLALATKRA